MKKVLVTGMTSTHCNPDRAATEVTFSTLIAEGCRALGYEVDHRNPEIKEELDEYDHVFIGIAPPHALGANRIYGAMSALLRSWADGRATLYIDDSDVSKIISGIRTQFNDPARFTKQLYQYRLGWETASEEPWKSWLYSGIKLLHENEWPTTLLALTSDVSLHKWGAKLPNAAPKLTWIDPSTLMTTQTPEVPSERGRWWVSESHADERWSIASRPVLDVHRYGSPKRGYTKRPNDAGLAQKYAEAWGVLQEPTVDHWWSSRLKLAIDASAIYVTKWQSVEHFGGAYGVLPDVAAVYDTSQRDQLAADQADAFNANVMQRSEVLARLKTLVEEKK